MVKIQIGLDERLLNEIDESWVAKQINGRRNNGEKVVVKVYIENMDFNMMLSTPDNNCSRGRAPNPNEMEIFELWRKHGLNQQDFSVGNVISFLKLLKHYVAKFNSYKN